MLPMLQEFFYYYYLPNLLDIRNIDETTRKWRPIKNLNILSNGLINDINYYKNNSRDYVVAVFKNFDCLHEINISDFVSLDNQTWISNFVLDIALNLLNVNNKYQIIRQELVSVIFNSEEISKSLIERINFVKDYLALPIFINGNHHCLIIIDFVTSTFCFMDPMSCNIQQEKYLNSFKKNLRMYNTIKSENINEELSVKVYNHVEQRDNFNCGLFCIRFFECIVSNHDMLKRIDMLKYRQEIKTLIINKSDDMAKSCLVSSRICDATTVKKCAFCKRLIQIECNLFRDESFINNGICQLCAQY
nr:uncharacterized protein LOC111513614 [Leptinotarsa decemlineata]